jgi:hypothetical protein
VRKVIKIPLQILIFRYSDEEYRCDRLNGNEEEYHKRYGKWGIQKIWRDDIFPCRVYLRHCVLATKKQGEAVYDNFLDHTFLGDRKTTIRKWLEMHPTIMSELPPEHLSDRYNG